MTSVTAGGPGLVAVGFDGIWDKIPEIGTQPPGFPQNETFVGDTATPEALALLTREYREGFVVPEV